MSGTPDFELTPNHEFKPKEKVLVIDANGYDLWEAVITSMKPGKYLVRYLGYDDSDEELEDTSRILMNTRTNRRIFNQQEAVRQTQLPPLGPDESEPFSDRSDDEERTGYDEPDAGSGGKKKKPKKAKKPKPGKKPKGKAKDQSKPRPEGSRISPRRGG
jgi:hypothetical protein